MEDSSVSIHREVDPTEMSCCTKEMLDERFSVPKRYDSNMEATVMPGANAIGRAFDVF
jgi:hypothetical protein